MDDQRRALWDEAETFDEAADHGLRDPATRTAWQRLLLPLLPEYPQAIADLGCGTPAQLRPVVVEEVGGGVIHPLPAEFFDDDLASGRKQCHGMIKGAVQIAGVVQGAGEQHHVVLVGHFVDVPP